MESADEFDISLYFALLSLSLIYKIILVVFRVIVLPLFSLLPGLYKIIWHELDDSVEVIF